MNLRVISVAVVFFLFSSASLWAQEPLTLRDCFKAALKQSEVLATQQEVVIQAEQNYRRAWAAILPSLNGSYAYFHPHAPGLTDSGNTSNTSWQQTLVLTADQPLFRGFRDFAAIHAAKSTITQQQLAWQWAGLQLYQDTAQAFYTQLAVQKDLQVLDGELAQYQQIITELQKRVSIGRSRVTEVLTIQAAQAILNAQREQVAGQLDVAREVLAFLTGLGPDVRLDDADPVPSMIEPLDAYQSEISARPDILAAQKNIRAFKSKISQAKGEYLPSVDLVSNYFVERPDRHSQGNWDVEIAVTLPIFTWGSRAADIKTAQSQERQAELQLSQVERMARQEVRSLYFSYKSDLAQTRALEEAFDIAQKNYDANAKDYQSNLVTNLDVLQALTSFQDTQRSLEKIRYLVRTDFNKLEASVARRLKLLNELDKA